MTKVRMHEGQTDPRAPPAALRPGNKFVGRLLVLAAALLWSSSGLFAKAPLFDDWSPEMRTTLLAFWRALFAALVLVPLVRRPRWRLGLVPVAVSFSAMNFAFLTAMGRTTAANAIWLQNTAPMWVFLMGLIVLREPVARRELVPLGFGGLGLAVILAMEVQGQAQGGVVFGVAAGACYAGVVVCMRHLRDEDPAWLVTVNHAAAAAVMLPWVIRFGLWPSVPQLLVLAVFGVVQMAIPYMLLLRALRTISSQEAVAIGLLEPVLMPLWVYLAWGEVPAWWTLVGAVLILTGLTLRYGVGMRDEG